MRCRRAERLMTVAVDGELSPRERRAFDLHVAGCGSCAAAMERTRTLLDAIAGLPIESEVPSALEGATRRRVRALADGSRADERAWWARPLLPITAFAATAVLAVAIGLRPGPDGPAGRVPEPAPTVAAPATEPEPVRVAQAPVPAPATSAGLPTEPPPDLAAAPALFIELPLIRNMEKLENFEAITMLAVDPPSG